MTVVVVSACIYEMSSPFFSEWCCVIVLYSLHSSYRDQSVIHLMSVRSVNLCQQAHLVTLPAASCVENSNKL